MVIFCRFTYQLYLFEQQLALQSVLHKINSDEFRVMKPRRLEVRMTKSISPRKKRIARNHGCITR